jgi:hypothetical protein
MKTVSLFVAALLVYNSLAFANEGAPTPGVSQVDAQKTTQVLRAKREVQQRGTGEKSRVKVRLIKGIEVKGYISKIDEASFAVTDKKSGKTTNVAYEEVQKIQGPGLSKGVKIGITLGVVGLVVAVTAIVVLAKCGSYCR